MDGQTDVEMVWQTDRQLWYPAEVFSYLIRMIQTLPDDNFLQCHINQRWEMQQTLEGIVRKYDGERMRVGPWVETTTPYTLCKRIPNSGMDMQTDGRTHIEDINIIISILCLLISLSTIQVVDSKGSLSKQAIVCNSRQWSSDKSEFEICPSDGCSLDIAMLATLYVIIWTSLGLNSSRWNVTRTLQTISWSPSPATSTTISPMLCLCRCYLVSINNNDFTWKGEEL